MRCDCQRGRNHRRPRMAFAIDVVEVESIDQCRVHKGSGREIRPAVAAKDRASASGGDVFNKPIKNARKRERVGPKQATDGIQQTVFCLSNHVDG